MDNGHGRPEWRYTKNSINAVILVKIFPIELVSVYGHKKTLGLKPGSRSISLSLR
jgi:hypothetical protein